MPDISRSDGYRYGRGKGEAGVQVVQGFLRTELDVPTDEITGREDNYRSGDLRAPSGQTLEVKRQDIDPRRYPQNFIEVFELTSGANPDHAAGFQTLAQLLDLGTDRLSQVTVHDRRARARGPLGEPPAVSVSIQSIVGSSFTAYVNPGTRGPAHLYLYDVAEIVAYIRRVAPRGFDRGLGRANNDTCSVFVPLAANRWSAETDGPWVYTGDRDEAIEVARIRGELLGA